MSLKDFFSNLYVNFIKPAWDKLFYILFINKPLFIGFLIGLTILVFVLLIYGACKTTTYPTAQEISLYPLDRPIASMPFELNIVKDDFTEKQISIVRDAVMDWQKFSDNRLIFIINEDWEPPVNFSYDFYSTYPHKTLWMKTGDDMGVVELFLKYSIIGDAFSVGNFVLIINDFNSIKDNKLYIILMHEISHQLGLEHIKDAYPALMNLGGNNGKFTIYDKIMFCELYGCN